MTRDDPRRSSRVFAAAAALGRSHTRRRFASGLSQVQYSCGHRCHAKCARESLSRGCPGPELTFSHLGLRMPTSSPRHCTASLQCVLVCTGCPLCGAAGELPLQNPALAAAAARWVALWEATRRCGRAQLRAAPAEERAKVEPGGEYDGRPVEGL